MTGVRAYMSGKLKVRGDLMLAQRLEEVFNKTGGQEVNIYVMILGTMSAAALNAFVVQRALEFLKKNEKEIASITRAKLWVALLSTLLWRAAWWSGNVYIPYCQK